MTGFIIFMVVFIFFIIFIFFFTRPNKRKNQETEEVFRQKKFVNLAIDGIEKGLASPKRSSTNKSKLSSNNRNLQSGTTQPGNQNDLMFPMYLMNSDNTPAKSHEVPHSPHNVDSHSVPNSHHHNHDYSSPASDSSSHGSHHSCSTPSSCSGASSCSGGSSCGGGGD